VIEEIIREPEVYREDTMVPVLCELEEKMEHFLEQYGRLSEKQLTDKRYDRFRRM
jgi:acetyl-CoA carboxylase alpha subunit